MTMIMQKFLANPLILPIWYSILCGIVVGLEREVYKKDAGIRTTVFICVGAAIYSFLGTRIAGTMDSSRVISQIVSGIGFIGGGVIIFDKDKLQGLTSAAIIWMVAAIGILNGLGMYFEAVMSAFTIVVINFTFNIFKKILKKIH